jgi:hypothetical protein
MENPDNAAICNSCGATLRNDILQQPHTKTKTSRLAIVSLLLSFLSIFTFFIAGLLSIALGIESLYRIKKHQGRLKGKYLAITGIVISFLSILFFIGALALWSLDAPPIQDDYTIADLRSAPTECARSYELLMSISEKEEYPPDAPLIGLSTQDVNTINQVSEVFKEGDYSKIIEALKVNAENINQAWKNAKKGRDIVNELNTFPEIADLTEPDLEANIGFLRNIKILAHLYQVYVYLQTEQGNSQSAVNELLKLDPVFRKLSINARSLVTKLVCFAGLNIGINTANFITNNPQTSQESIKLLAEHFTPLTNEQFSLRNSIISEYLMFKSAFNTTLNQRGMRNNPMLKRNSSFRLYRNFCVRWIDVWGKSGESGNPELSVWPLICPNWIPVSIDSEGKVPWIYTAYNPIGSVLIRILTPAFEKVFEMQTKLKVQDDLFQIVLNKRLDNEISLKAHAYSDEYIIDVEKKIFSPGPDGKLDTKDDIKLVINPKVLGLVSE